MWNECDVRYDGEGPDVFENKMVKARKQHLW